MIEPDTLLQQESWRWRLSIFAGYLLLALLFTWPLVFHLGSGVIQKGGRPIDTGQGIWSLWWVLQSALHGFNPYLTRYVFFPNTINLFWETLSLPNTLLALPFTLAFGPIVAFNLLAILSFALSGFWTYCIIRALQIERAGALLGGFVYGFAPFHMQVLYGGALDSTALHWIPLYVLLLLRALRRPSVLRVGAAGATLVLMTLASYYYGIYSAIFTACLILVFLPAQAGWPARLRSLLVGAAIAATWVAVLLPLAGGGVGVAAPGDWYSRQFYHSVALVDLLMPNTLHPLWGAAAARWLVERHQFGPEAGASLGLVTYGLVIAGAITGRRRAWPWAALALLTFLFALGPELKLTDQPTGIPMPFRGLDVLGPMRNSSRPANFVAIWMLPLSVLVSFGVAALGRLSGHALPYAIGAASACVLFELLVAPWPITLLQVGAGYQALAADPEPGALLELPPDNDGSQYMINQICHGRALVGGYLARTPEYLLAAYNSAIWQLWYAKGPVPDVMAINLADDLAAVGVRSVALNLGRLSARQAQALRKQLAAPGIRLISRDAGQEFYQIDMQRGAAMMLMAAGWSEPEVNGEHAWRWMGAHADIRVFARADALVTLRFDATAFQAERTLDLALDGAHAGSYTIPAAPGARPIQLTIFVPAGEHVLQFSSAPDPAPDGRTLSLSIERAQLNMIQIVGSPEHTDTREPTLAMPFAQPICGNRKP
jgi:hypothetical protein